MYLTRWILTTRLSWCSHWTWWIIPVAFAKPGLADFFVSGQSGEAISPWSEDLSDFFCWPFHHPPSDRPLHPHLAFLVLKRKRTAMGMRSPRASTIAGWFCRLPWPAFVADSVAQQSATALSWLHKRHAQRGMGTDKMVVVLPLDMVDNSISLFVAVFVRIWPQFGKELAPVSPKWRLFCLVTSQHLLRLGAWRIIHHI
jgi:hypothetical protein